MNNKNYAIARIKKHQKTSQVSYLLNHHLRSAEVHNADPDRANQNRILLKVDDPQKFIDEAPAGTRKNAVRFVDVLFTASDFKDKKQLDAWVDQTFKFATKTFGKENIALATLHMDETTPHIHVMFKPVAPTGKMNAGHWFRGREKMRKFQDDYHNQVKGLGFDRGEPGSRAKHTTINEFYKDVNTAEKNHKNTVVKPLVSTHKKVSKMSFLGKLQWFKKDFKSLLGGIANSSKPTFLLAEMADKKEVERLKKIEEEAKKDKILLEATQEKLLSLTGSKLPSSSEIQKAKQQKIERDAASKIPKKSQTPSANPPSDRVKNRDLPTPFNQQKPF